VSNLILIITALWNKNYQNWWKFDKVLTRTILHSFWDMVYYAFVEKICRWESIALITEGCSRKICMCQVDGSLIFIITPPEIWAPKITTDSDFCHEVGQCVCINDCTAWKNKRHEVLPLPKKCTAVHPGEPDFFWNNREQRVLLPTINLSTTRSPFSRRQTSRECVFSYDHTTDFFAPATLALNWYLHIRISSR